MDLNLQDSTKSLEKKSHALKKLTKAMENIMSLGVLAQVFILGIQNILVPDLWSLLSGAMFCAIKLPFCSISATHHLMLNQ